MGNRSMQVWMMSNKTKAPAYFPCYRSDIPLHTLKVSLVRLIGLRELEIDYMCSSNEKTWWSQSKRWWLLPCPSFFLENGTQWPVSTMVVVLLLLFGQVGFRSNNKDVCRKRSAFVNRMDESEDMEEGMEYTKQIKNFPRQKKIPWNNMPEFRDQETKECWSF